MNGDEVLLAVAALWLVGALLDVLEDKAATGGADPVQQRRRMRSQLVSNVMRLTAS